jgi:hypothetical protein
MAFVSGFLVLPPGSPAPNSVIRMQLVYCGGNAGRVPAGDPNTPATVVSFLPFDVPVLSDGSWSTDLYGNDVIICGTDVSGPSRWRIKPVFNGISGPAIDYQIQSGGNFSPDTAPQCSATVTTNCAVSYPYTTPPPPPVQGPPGPPGPAGPPGAAGGAVNNGTVCQIAYYAATGTTLSGDSNLCDSGSALSYAFDFNLAGNETIDQSLFFAGPLWMDSPIPASPVAAAPSGRTGFGVSSDGYLYASILAASPVRICTAGDATCGTSITINGQVIAPGGSGNVNNGAAAHSLALNEGNGNAQTGLLLAANNVPMGVTGADPGQQNIPTCSAGQSLTFNGSNFSCVSTSASAILSSNTTTLTSDVTGIAASTDTTWLSVAVVIPSTGCTPKCRVLVSYSVFYVNTNSGNFIAWVTDSLSNPSFASSQGNQTGANSNGSGLSASALSAAYNPGAHVTFTFKFWTSAAGTGTTVKAGSDHPCCTVSNSWTSLVTMTSAN